MQHIQQILDLSENVMPFAMPFQLVDLTERVTILINNSAKWKGAIQAVLLLIFKTFCVLYSEHNYLASNIMLSLIMCLNVMHIANPGRPKSININAASFAV